jgi:hypothetical protein
MNFESHLDITKCTYQNNESLRRRKEKLRLPARHGRTLDGGKPGCRPRMTPHRVTKFQILMVPEPAKYELRIFYRLEVGSDVTSTASSYPPACLLRTFMCSSSNVINHGVTLGYCNYTDKLLIKTQLCVHVYYLRYKVRKVKTEYVYFCCDSYRGT